MLSQTTITAAQKAGNRDRKIIRRLARQGPYRMDRRDPVAVEVDEVRVVEEFCRESADKEMREPVEAG